MTIKVLELHHHAIRVGPTQAEADVVRDFYVNVLGLAQDLGRTVRSKAPGYWLDVADHAQLHLMGVTGIGIDLGDGIDPSRPHVALAVADVAAARAELERLGVPHRALEGATGPTSVQLFLKDPAGNLVELHQAGACRCVPRSRVDAEPVSYSRVQGAVMFADMRGFTAISERLSPDAVVPLLNEYFTLLIDITDAHGGTVFNMAGDGLMAGFGVPEWDDDAPGRAVAAAREMLMDFGDLARRWKTRLDIDTGLGIGINAGEVIAGNVGSATHRSYTLIGDTVNVASRLSQRARAGEALFSAGVRRWLGTPSALLPLLELPSLQLRGRASPVEIYCIPAQERIDFRPEPLTA